MNNIKINNTGGKKMELLKGKAAIITGGTRGIGFATVHKFLENGARVAIFGSRQETVENAIEKLKSVNPNWDVVGKWPKLTDYNEVEQAINEVKEEFGKIDILVNNAGVSARDPLHSYDPASFDRTMQINVNAVFYTSRVVAPIMKEHGGGVILNTSSMVSKYGQPAGVAYPASKFAVNGISKSLARELAHDNIRVNAVAPGITRTDMFSSLPKETADNIARGIPLGRVGEPEDVANAFLFLASDLASYITGVILAVDGAAMN